MRLTVGFLLREVRVPKKDDVRRFAVALALAVGLAAQAQAFILACLGDSNTDPGHQAFLEQTGWCELIAARYPDWTVVNYALVWSTAVARCESQNIYQVFCGDGPQGQMATALAQVHPDLVIAAFGTNDIVSGYSAAAVLEAYVDMASMADSNGAGFLPALTPPTEDGTYADAIAALNDVIRSAFPSTVDFFSHFRPFEYADPLHLNARGQRHRYWAARRAIRRWQGGHA